ncbi:hypothetical protein R3P38DRAFT_1965270 [Favolaschia claudopus]|uniref:C2H2-type domain-containing protein n=1 Tax=Favolaschia claudopus TaxID=2862362 RepID=A0AAW0A0P3_9AGAR
MDFRIQQMEREFCSDYKCCNIKLSDMHALFAHLETCHSGNTTDNLSFSASDPVDSTNETSFDAPSPFSSTIDSPLGSLSPIDANSSYTSPLSTPEPIFLTSLYPDIQDLQSPLSPTISPASAASHPTVPPPGLDLSSRVQFNCLTSAQTRDKLYVPVSIPSNMRSAAKPPQPATPSQRPVSFIPHATGYGYGFYYLPLMPSSNSLAPVPVATKGPKPLSRQNSVSSLTCIADSEPAATPAARPTTSPCHDSLATAASSFLSSCPSTPGPVFPARQAPIFATPASPSVNVNVSSVSSSSPSQKPATATHSLAQLRFRFFGGAGNGSRWSDPLAGAGAAEVTPRSIPVASSEICEECIQPEAGGEVVEAVDARGAGGDHGASGREECVVGPTDREEANVGVRERQVEGVESLVDEVEWANNNCGNVSAEDSGGVALTSIAASHVSGDQRVVEGDVEDGMESVSPSLPPIDRPLFVNGKYHCPVSIRVLPALRWLCSPPFDFPIDSSLCQDVFIPGWIPVPHGEGYMHDEAQQVHWASAAYQGLCWQDGCERGAFDHTKQRNESRLGSYTRRTPLDASREFVSLCIGGSVSNGYEDGAYTRQGGVEE